MSKERYLEQEINKDLRILELERQLAEARESHRLAEEGVKFWITKYNELKEKGDE